MLELLAEVHEFEAAAGGFGGDVEADEGSEAHAVSVLDVCELEDDAGAAGDEFADGGVKDVGGSGDEAAVADDEDDSVGIALDLGGESGVGWCGVEHGCHYATAGAVVG